MKVVIYANGIVHCSVCAPGDMPVEDVEREVNAINMSGVSPWKVSKERFNGGEDNPHTCEKDSGKKHYLMVC